MGKCFSITCLSAPAALGRVAVVGSASPTSGRPPNLPAPLRQGWLGAAGSLNSRWPTARRTRERIITA